MLSRIQAGCFVVAVAIALSVLASVPHAAYAQDDDDDDDAAAVPEDKSIPADFKGSIGLGLIGAELGS